MLNAAQKKLHRTASFVKDTEVVKKEVVKKEVKEEIKKETKKKVKKEVESVEEISAQVEE